MNKLKNASVAICMALFISNTYAQLPLTFHAAPSGVVINNARVNDMAVDASNNKWMAFGNYGLGIYDGAGWTMYNTSNSTLPSDSTTSLVFDGSGNAWIGTKAGAVYKTGSVFTTYNTSNSGIVANIITAVLSDGPTTWFGTHQGLASFDGSTWSVFNSGNSPMSNDSVTVLKRDNAGNLWIGTRNGLFSKNGSNWNAYTPANSDLNRYIIDVECDNNNTTWVSSGELALQPTLITSGIFFITNGNVQNFDGDFYHYEFPVVYSRGVNFSKDASNRIYFRVNLGDDGIARIDGSGFDFFELPTFNPGVNAFGSIFEVDNNGLLWTIPRYRFYFYSFDVFNYQQPLLGGIHYENYRTLDINDVKAAIIANGDMHWNYSDAQYEIPRGSDKNTVFASALWIGGLDEQGELHMAAQTYRQSGDDYWAGPIDGISVPFDSASCRLFDRVWKMNKWKIEEFKNQFLAGNVTNGTYQVPEEIASWPAKGNGVVTDNKAPFVDANGDGIYAPLQGDYPLIKGDQMLYRIFNDSLSQHFESGGWRLGMEIHASAYAFHCEGIADSNQVLNRTTFYDYKIINKSTHLYDSMYLGLWADMDLGNPIDDFIGCDTIRAAGFAYNGDNNDDFGSFSPGYGLNPPMQNVKILRGIEAEPGDGIDNNLNGIIDEPGERTSMNHFQYYNNVNNSPIGNPQTPIDFYNYLRSIWLDGQHVTFGGDGKNPANPLSNFMFSGKPYSGTGWTETSAGNPPEDRRFLMSTGPFTLEPGDTATIDFAYVFTWDSLSPNGLNTSIARNLIDLDRVQNWFNNNNFPTCEVYSTGINEYVDPTGNITVYPNPATDKIFVQYKGENTAGSNYTIYNLLGEVVMTGKMFTDYIFIGKLSEQSYILKLEINNGHEFVRFVKL